ncbi:MAG: hypothetical protein ABSD58_00700 [Verrucomicrobiia bacterium]|jgi:hypothetical protein
MTLLVNVTVYVPRVVKLAVSDGPGTPFGLHDKGDDQTPPTVFVQLYAVAWALSTPMDNPSANAKAPATKLLIDLGGLDRKAGKRFTEIISYPFLKTSALFIPSTDYAYTSLAIGGLLTPFADASLPEAQIHRRLFLYLRHSQKSMLEA